jgi:26S proteasome non-ATPase regulatory subunit 9
MGIPMESMHTPSVASGPTTANGVRELDLSKLTLPGLIEEKERLESELKALGSVLETVSEMLVSYRKCY